MLSHSLANVVTIEQSGSQWVPMQAAANMSTRMDHILQAMPSGIVILDEDGVVTEANTVAKTLLGEPLEGIRWLTIIERAFAPRKDDGHEISLRDGRRVKLAMTPLSPEPGQLIVLTDLTETRQLQTSLSHLERLSALGKMVANLAHQVRTPLSAAILYASNLKQARLSSDARERFSDKLLDRLSDLERQVNDMLLMARGQANGQETLISAEQLMHQVMSQCEPIVSKQGGRIMVAVQQDSQINVNINAMASAIGNLVMNSLEAGGTDIRLVVMPDAHCPDKRVQLLVTDDGQGMAKEAQQQVLDPFFTTKPQGTGLGLAVVQSVAQQHQGTLTLSCTPGKGCIVAISLPIADFPTLVE
ncbi:PAS domain-containing sensor histidine kinase [Shewanella sp. NIFS-20-20]|uniref:sensor histidine kinase n=1 Tax=Shewanella sp. NIFS-20-20 TaxID=2853806 RepID=UPI001C451339|nr:ATP-binding protein [Shewanella sp. NIFS-20-20]MBV7314789.1 PAS domain-containing protein [Shewanella sp. NIFS-20-20]